MRKDDLEHMPKTQDLIVENGIEYSNAFATTSQCCPSRASIMRGQYAHNHGVLGNFAPQGGFQKFKKRGNESSTVATWLHDAGYATALFGKYLNEYPDGRPEHVPPGWDEWYASIGPAQYYDYDLVENGKKVHYGSREEDYETDVLSRKATGFIARRAEAPTPLFMYVAPAAPHVPPTGAPRHKRMFEGVKAPRSPSFDEGNISDKPGWVRDNFSRLDRDDERRIDRHYRERLRSLQAVDDMVEAIAGELRAAGRLENTYLVFASDNGWHLGEHRISGEKNSPYEESIRIPLAVSGPGIPAGRRTEQMALNTDLAPTFADLAGVEAPSFVDGRSLRPTFTSDASTWRTAFLEEFWAGNPVPRHKAVRTADHKYVEYAAGSKELYDLSSDPYELKSFDESAERSLIGDLQRRLEALKNCSGESCRDAEDAP